MNDRTAALVQLAAAFPRDRVPESTIALYDTKLSRLDEPTLVAVIEKLMESARSFPTLAEIREAFNQAWKPPHREALPEGSVVPMPKSVKQQLAELHSKMDERAEEMSS